MKDKKGHLDKRILITLTFKMPTRQGTGGRVLIKNGSGKLELTGERVTKVSGLGTVTLVVCGNGAGRAWILNTDRVLCSD